MPQALVAALPAILGVVGSAASAGMNVISSNKKDKQAQQAQMANVTKPGFSDFGGDMAQDGAMNRSPNLSLTNARRPVIFNRKTY